jgi:HSP20 family protein
MASTDTDTNTDTKPEPAHGVRDLIHRPGWLSALEHAFATTPMRIEDGVEGDEFVVRAEMPGIDPEQDVEINVSDGMLQVRAERREEHRREEAGRRHSEFHYGSFSRVVPLPAGATESDVKATYHDGILEVRIPVDHHKAEATRVPVTRT